MTPADLIDLSALTLVVGGIALATLLRTPWAELRETFAAVARRPLSAAVGAELARLEQAAARHGRFAVDPALPADPDLDAAARLIARGSGRAAVADLLDGQRARRADGLARHRALFDGAAETAPVLGLIGTVVGLMALFADGAGALSGGGLATALTTTLYGAVLATFVLSPLSARLAARTAREEAERLGLEARLLALVEEGAARAPTRLVRVA